MKNVGRCSFALLAVLCLAACSQDAAPVISYAQLQGAGSTGMLTIAHGDTVGNIAARYDLDIRDIIIVNGLDAPYRLVPGERLKLPAPRTYRVRNGDTLYGVAHTFSASVSQIARLNNIGTPYGLTPGQVLKLPVVADAPDDGNGFTVPRVAAGTGPRVAALRPQDVQAQNLPGRASRPAIAAPPPRMAKPWMQAKVPDDTPARSGNGKFLMPVSGRVISAYGPKPGGLHNDGVNIKAPRGTPVRAAENGIVVYVGDQLKGYGRLILIRHAGHWMTAYAHLGQVRVKKGQRVKRGQIIGAVGQSGNVDQPQLHFEIRHGTNALNPQKFV